MKYVKTFEQFVNESVNESKSVKVGDFIKTEYGYYYKRVAGKVGGREAFIEIMNGKEGKRKTSLHSSAKFEVVDAPDDLKESVNEEVEYKFDGIVKISGNLYNNWNDREIQKFLRSLKSIQVIGDLNNVLTIRLNDKDLKSFKKWMKESVVNEAKKPLYKKGQKIQYQLEFKGGVGKYAGSISKSKNVETGVIKKRKKTLASYDYELTDGLVVHQSVNS